MPQSLSSNAAVAQLKYRRGLSSNAAIGDVATVLEFRTEMSLTPAAKVGVSAVSQIAVRSGIGEAASRYFLRASLRSLVADGYRLPGRRS